jgi:hypothetical protein
LKVKNMMASAAGTVEQPGKKVRQKSWPDPHHRRPRLAGCEQYREEAALC